jgi:hypothetical protein
MLHHHHHNDFIVVACSLDKKNYTILVRKPLRKRILGRPRRTEEYGTGSVLWTTACYNISSAEPLGSTTRQLVS